MMISLTQREAGEILAQWAADKYGAKFNYTAWYMDCRADDQIFVEIDYVLQARDEARKQAADEFNEGRT